MALTTGLHENGEAATSPATDETAIKPRKVSHLGGGGIEAVNYYFVSPKPEISFWTILGFTSVNNRVKRNRASKRPKLSVMNAG